MEPLTATAAIAVASSLAQAWQSEKARGANQRELDRIKKIFESIVPPEYDISINDPPDYIQKALPPAALDFSRITPEDFKVVGVYAPQAAQYVAEQAPQLLQGSAAQKEGFGAQRDALRQYQQLAKGEDPEFKIKMAEAARNAQAAAQSRSATTLQDAQRRGMAGSGLSFAAMLQGNSDAMQMGAQQSQNAAIEAYRNKLAAIREAGSMGRQLSQDETAREQYNVGVTNDFNQRTSKAYRDYLNQKAAMENNARLLNLQNEQNISNANVDARNSAQEFNLNNRNKLAQQSYENERSERNYQNQMRENLAKWSASEKNRQNDLARQKYDDQMRRASGMAGIGREQQNMNTQRALDYNNMIQSVGAAGAGYFQQSAADQREKDRWENIQSIYGKPPTYGSSSVNWDEDERNKYRGLS